jgi:hypothetical protein
LRVSNEEVEERREYELVPFNDLLESVVVTVVAWESVGVHKATQGVTTLIEMK